MSELLVNINPALIHGNKTAGDVISVQPDGFEWGRMERRQFAIVKSHYTVEEARAIYMQDGIPQADKDREAAEQVEWQAALVRGERPPVPFRIDPKQYPNRKVYIDPTVIPKGVKDCIAETHQALEDCHAEAQAAARQVVEAKLIEIKGALDEEDSSLTTRQLYENLSRNAIAPIESKLAKGLITKEKALEEKLKVKDRAGELLSASRAGALSVEQPILDAIQLPEVVELDEATIKANTHENGI